MTWVRTAGCLAAVVAAVVVPGAAGQEPVSLPIVLARAGAYVERYEQELSGIVAEEEYVQEIHTSGGQPRIRRRTLKSDLLLIRPELADRYVQFRDTFEVDGRPVRDRSERLLKLFLQPSDSNVARAQDIMTESARYNIGSIARTINVPVMALLFLQPKWQPRFRFSVSDEDKGPAELKGVGKSANFTMSVDVWAIEYREVGDPTIIQDPRRERNVRSHGRFWIEPASGRVLMSELVAVIGSLQGTVRVSYQSAPIGGLLVPIEMRESYVNSARGLYVIEGAATYGNFRRFQVQVDESIGPVKDQPRPGDVKL